MRMLICAFLVFVSTGCAGARYQKDGGTTQEFLHDKVDCQVKATQAGYSQKGFASIHYKRFFEECLAGQGWNRI